MAPLKALVFDMDDTLYPERNYVMSGFSAIASIIELEVGLPAEETFLFLQQAQVPKNRGRVFDALLDARTELIGHFTVPDLIMAYRQHQPKIDLYPEMASILDWAIAQGLRLGLISDGDLDAQSNKVQALGLDHWFDPIILTGSWGRPFWKPHPRAFLLVEESYRFTGPAIAYIGDNPTKDFIAPNLRNWMTIQITQPGQVHATSETFTQDMAATHQADSTFDLFQLIQSNMK